MSATVRVIVVNTDEEAAPELRSHLLSVDGVKIVAEVDEPAFLAQALNQFHAEVVLLHLDPTPGPMMDVITPLLEARKGEFVAIGMTEDRDAELVVRAMRAGMREFLWKPFPPEQLTEILRRVQNEAPEGVRRSGKLIPVVATSGGAGATTIATNLAVELAQLENWDGQPATGGKPRVAIVDLDFRFGQVAMFLDAQPDYTIAELCDSAEMLEADQLERAMYKHPSGVHVLAHPPDFEQAERITAAQAVSVLAALQEHYDYVVLDGPLRLDHSARAIFDMTDMYLLVVQLLVPSVRSADRYISELRRSGYNTDRIRLVCNRYGREAAFLEPGDVETTLNRKLGWILPDDWKSSSTSVNVGQPLLESAPKSKLRSTYQQMAQDIAKAPPSETDSGDEGDGKKGLFSLLSRGG